MAKGAAILAAAAALAACSGRPSDPVSRAPCPQIAILAEAADLTRHRPGGGTDLSAMVVDARVSGFEAACDFASRAGGLDVTVTPRFSVERGPAGGQTADLPWLVSVVDPARGEVTAQARQVTRVSFPGAAGFVAATGAPVTIRLPGDPAAAARQQVLIGFALTAEELALNRRRGVR
ncbi:MAG: hypothetical protein NZM27_10410 [Acetobacteraceae bacterium]|nr:hypothetical protein [Acetobacteraceae bacterium]MCX7686038.1 hypothetical protein [Acetobacteraceae bacterium]MDW8397590.1 hypothetical protein [Acetobacteraceae bacterium]